MKKISLRDMLKNPKKVFGILLVFSVLLAIIDMPENFNITIPIPGAPITYTLNPPVIDVSLLGLHMKKEVKTHYGLDLAGGTHLVLEADMKDVKAEDRMNAIAGALQVIERRVNFFGVSEPIVQSAKSGNTYRIVVELPGITKIEEAVATIGQTAQLEFREFIDQSDSTASGFIIPTLQTTAPVDITGRDLKRAVLTFSSQTGEPEVAITFSGDGVKKFSDVTKRLIGKNLAIFLDDFPVTWPMVNTEITDGNAVITGSFTQQSAKRLALQLNAGALPVPVSIVEKRTIGATLGAQSVQKSVRAGVIGLLFVVGFMIMQYGRLGVIASLALILYGLITMALYRLIPITLTLPGIAGFILSIGMAVDSNILIFERYKEELRRGKPWRIAIELGFGKAWDSIRDANFTTILTSIILFNPGNWEFLPSSGLVRGFATTLFVGVVVSLFTGIVVTRTYIRVLYKPPKGII